VAEGRQLVSPAEHRYLMTVIATASNPHFWVSRVDIDRPGPTYTIDTLRDLSVQHPDAELFFITGADALEQILSWKDADELFGLAHFVGVTRPGVRAVRRPPAPGRGEPGRGARDGDLVQRVPRAGARRAPGLVSGARWRRAVHRQAPPVPWDSSREPRPDRPAGRDGVTRPVTATDRAREIALAAAQAAADKLATDVVLLDVSDRLVITDIFVIASAPNERQVESIVEAWRSGCGATASSRCGARASARAAGSCSTSSDVVVHVQHRRGALLLRPGAAVEGLPDDPVRRPVAVGAGRRE
jgi:ribosomal silencing factor RsfS